MELNNVDISGEIGNLTINGIEVGPLAEAELDRRYPGRAAMRPADAAGFRADAGPVQAPGWPESRSYRMRNLPLHVLHEEWEHRLYAERDPEALEDREPLP